EGRHFEDYGSCEAVRTQLAAANFGGDTSKVFRLSGANRYETAAAIESAADWLGEAWSPGVALAFVATGLNFPDALAGAALAGADDGPILLVAANTPIPAASDTALGALDPHGIIIFGGPGVVSDAIMAALAGYLAP
ncbi:MAG: cell wall-binding repeat-containing protein, partial [Candidatus Limnocylindrales bacterium]